MYDKTMTFSVNDEKEIEMKKRLLPSTMHWYKKDTIQ